jgi:ectoine hydroxylase-related dioxygenase (phytanoyl-CoA dioxygenase family)
MNGRRERIERTGCSPISQLSWTKEDLAALREEGADKIALAGAERGAKFDLHLGWPRLFDLVTDKSILGRLTEIFDDDCFQLVETRLYPKQPGGGVDWHIDVFQLLYFEPSLIHGATGFHSVTTWLALDDVPADAGPIQMIHYKHVDLEELVRLYRNRMLPRYRELCQAEADRNWDRVEAFPMKAGEFVMFDPRNLHTGGANQTTRPRLGMVLRYCASHVRVNPRFSKTGALQVVRIENGNVVRPTALSYERHFSGRQGVSRPAPLGR